MRKLFTAGAFVLILASCTTSSCYDLPTEFSSYDEVEKEIIHASFSITEIIETPESTWIENATFYSCDGNLGYLRIATDHQNYFHKGVPRKMWEEFKSSDSKGKFYNENLRNNFQLLITSHSAAAN